MTVCTCSCPEHQTATTRLLLTTTSGGSAMLDGWLQDPAILESVMGDWKKSHPHWKYRFESHVQLDAELLDAEVAEALQSIQRSAMRRAAASDDTAADAAAGNAGNAGDAMEEGSDPA